MQSAINVFKNNQSKVSAHFVVGRDGSVVQMVKLTDAAWHAMHVPNYMSFGIEMEDRYLVGGQLTRGCMNDPTWFTAVELETTAELVAQLMKEFNIPLDKVMGHNDPYLRQFGNNHQDPGPSFPWVHFRSMVAANMKLLELVKQQAVQATASIELAAASILLSPKTRKPRGRPLGKRRK